MSANNDTVIKLNNISKRFGGIYALKDVTFELKKEIHSVIGHNGAGKSTMMKIIMGALKPDTGEIFLNGNKVSFNSPREAQNAGISMVWQELSNFPNLTITENMLMQRYKRTTAGAIDWEASHKLCKTYLERLELDLKPETKMKDISLAQQQLVEFAKALSYDPVVMILDEPTSALSIKEQEVLYDKIRMIKEQGVAVIFISHKLDEILLLSDRITVMRDGKRVFSKPRAELDKSMIVDAIIGNDKKEGQETEAISYGTRKKIKNAPVLLKVENLNKERTLSNISFELKAGELLGITGVSGSGITNVGEILFGIDTEYTGTMTFEGRPYKAQRPQDAVRKGLGYVPKNRKEEGIIPGLSVGDNMVLPILSSLSKLGFINHDKRKKLIDEIMENIDLRPKNPEIPIGSLSGGNQQKGVMARWVNHSSKLLILDEPTRGVDVGAIHKIYSLIRDMADEGLGVIIISSEFEEIYNVADRMLILNRGRISGEMIPPEGKWEDAFAMSVK